MKKSIDERNYGIDLLRIVAMFMVVLLHSLGQGGVLKSVVIGSFQYKVAWLMEICAYGAVDIFALISGYVAYNDKEKKNNYANYVILWFEVVFYGLLITVCFNIYNPSLISIKDYLMAIFPVSNDAYWYFTAYTGLFILMPLLDAGLRNIDNVVCKNMLFLLLVLFSFINTFTDVFKLSKGYSFVWLVILYILGGIIKKCNLGSKLKKYQIILSIVGLFIITYLFKIYGNGKISDLLISYISPTILISAILFIIYFSRIKFNDLGIKIVKFLAPSTFSVYLINTNRLVFKYIIKNMFIFTANQSFLCIIFIPISFSIVFVIGSILIDKLRQLLFQKIQLKYRIEKIIG